MLIGLAGKKESGKDTAGSYLVRQYGFDRRSFADKLKEAAAALFDVPLEKVDELKSSQAALNFHFGGVPMHDSAGTEIFSKGYLFRYVLQRFGTEMGRNVFGENFWVDLCLPLKTEEYESALQEIELEHLNIVVTDVRFDNEAKRIKDLNGYVIEIKRPRPEVDMFDEHASEQIDFPVDSIVLNTGTIADLQMSMDDIIRRYR